MTEILLLQIYINIAINFHGIIVTSVAVAFLTAFYKMKYLVSLVLNYASRCHGLYLSSMRCLCIVPNKLFDDTVVHNQVLTCCTKGHSSK